MLHRMRGATRRVDSHHQRYRVMLRLRSAGVRCDRIADIG